MFKFPPELTIAHIADCKQSLLEVIKANDVIHFDDTDVVRVDTLGIQLLLACVIDIASKKKELHWQSSSELILKNVENLGIKDPILLQHLNT
ncbi:STAS domain-containing protein [Thalassotalea sp. PLHSN55]|uniref:STAS domain-containing protein n=1 Tax=Thalassotalea sp. PLHSN55 TaxID=3435888 RepID=UPI003F8503B9